MYVLSKVCSYDCHIYVVVVIILFFYVSQAFEFRNGCDEGEAVDYHADRHIGHSQRRYNVSPLKPALAARSL